MSNNIETAAVCLSCGRIVRYDVAFDVEEDYGCQPAYTKRLLNREIFETYCVVCKTKMITVDPMIAVPVSRINHAGYKTNFSCQGHWRKIIRVIPDEKAKDRVLMEDYAVDIPYLALDELSVTKKRKIFEIASNITKDLPNYNIRVEFLVEVVDRIKGKREIKLADIAHIVKKAGFWSNQHNRNLWKTGKIWLGCNIPDAFKDIDSFYGMDPVEGESMVKTMSLNFQSFLMFLADELEKR